MAPRTEGWEEHVYAQCRNCWGGIDFNKAHHRYLTFPNDCKVTGVADIYVDKAMQHVKEYNLDAVAVADYHQLLADASIDLVSICTPPSTHAQIVIDCLNAGKHVLVEKPMAASLEECDAMVAAAQKNGKLLSVVAQNRFQTSWMKLKTVLDQKVAGHVGKRRRRMHVEPCRASHRCAAVDDGAPG